MKKTIAYILQFVSHNKLCENDGDLNSITDLAQNVYSVENSEQKFKGTSSSEAPLQYLMDKAWRELNQPQYSNTEKEICILPIVSYELYNGSNNKGPKKKLYDIYIGNIENFRRNIGILENSVKTEPIFYDFNPVNNVKFKSSAESTKSINKGIFDHIVNRDTDSVKFVLVDYTGGLRDTSYLVTQIIQYLSFFNIPMIKVVYSNLFDKTIHSITYLNRISHMINSVNNLSLSGNPSQLLDFFQNSMVDKDDDSFKNLSDYQTVIKALKDIKDFYGCVCINDIANIDRHKGHLEESILKIRDLQKSSNIYISMFSWLFENIRKQFFLNGHDHLSYEELIQWCINHRQINQAVTLFVEKMPHIYLQSEFICNLIKFDDNSSNIHFGDPLATKFYQGLYDNISVIHAANCPIDQLEKEEQITLFTTILKQVASENMNDVLKSDKQIKKNNNKNTQGKYILNQLNSVITNSSQYYKTSSFVDTSHSLMNYVNINYSSTENKFPKPLVGITIKNKDALAFINQLIQRKDWIGKIMFGESFNYAPDKDTFTKKLNAIKLVLHSAFIPQISDNEKRRQLAEIMRYYLIIKIIRNHMNHAVDQKNEDVKNENSIIEECVNGFGILPLQKFSGINAESIIGILQTAVSLKIPQ